MVESGAKPPRRKPCITLNKRGRTTLQNLASDEESEWIQVGDEELCLFEFSLLDSLFTPEGMGLKRT